MACGQKIFNIRTPQIDLKSEFHATKFLGFCSFYDKFRGFQRSTFAGFPGQWMATCPIISMWLITAKG